jgi:beta-lactamase superfamily II metal-dependent hydrolase
MDLDHMGGMINLICGQDFDVREIYYNHDGSKSTEAYKILRSALRAKTSIREFAAIDTTPAAEVSEVVSVEFLYPRQSTAGSQGDRGEFGSINSNSASAVVRVDFGTARVVTVTGDIEESSLAEIENSADLTAFRAFALVYPHHGSDSPRDSRAFAAKLQELVAPRAVLFSFANRTGYNRPDSVAVEVFRDTSSIACTGMSNSCGNAAEHAHCAGDITIGLRNGELQVLSRDSHLERILSLTSDERLCGTAV